MAGRGQHAHDNQSAQVHDRGEQEGVGSPRRVAAQKIAGAPRQHSRQTVCVADVNGSGADMLDERTMLHGASSVLPGFKTVPPVPSP